jgi:hypothetical protein
MHTERQTAQQCDRPSKPPRAYSRISMHASSARRVHILTCLLVEKYLDLLVGLSLQCIAESFDGRGVGELAVHHRAHATPLKQLVLRVSGQLDERLAGVDDRVVDDTSICHYVAATCRKHPDEDTHSENK